MEHTSLTLLTRLQFPNDSEAWQNLFQIYQPLLLLWLKNYDVQASDADDLVQEVFATLSKDLMKFHHNGRQGAFRNWLKNILVNRLRTFWRTRNRHPDIVGGSSIEERIAQFEDPTSAISQLWNRQHDLHVLNRLLELSRPSFSTETWDAFTRVAIHGQRPDFVAAQTGLTLNAVFIAKSRVLRKLREAAIGLVESSSKNFPTNS